MTGVFPASTSAFHCLKSAMSFSIAGVAKPFADADTGDVVVAFVPAGPRGPVSPLGPCGPCDPVAPFKFLKAKLKTLAPPHRRYQKCILNKLKSN